MDSKRSTTIYPVKSLELILIETVSDQIIAEINSH
jgi:hypothetical protein